MHLELLEPSHEVVWGDGWQAEGANLSNTIRIQVQKARVLCLSVPACENLLLIGFCEWKLLEATQDNVSGKRESGIKMHE